MLARELGLYVSLDHVGKHSSLKVWKVEVRPAGSHFERLLDHWLDDTLPAACVASAEYDAAGMVSVNGGSGLA